MLFFLFNLFWDPCKVKYSTTCQTPNKLALGSNNYNTHHLQHVKQGYHVQLRLQGQCDPIQQKVHLVYFGEN